MSIAEIDRLFATDAPADNSIGFANWEPAEPTADENPAAPIGATADNPADHLRESFAAARVSFQWFGTSKTLTASQKAQAASTFGADGKSLSAGKKLIDTRHVAYRACTTIRNAATAYWRDNSLPYPEPGLRLMRQDRVEAFATKMEGFRADLAEKVAELGGVYAELRDDARRRLGDLFSSADYPGDLSGMFSLTWDFPNVTPPDYLQQLNPELYEQEQRRIAARFDEAVRLAEESFTADLQRVVANLVDCVTRTDDNGKPKIFRDSAVGNLREFFDRFQVLNIHSSAELDRLVETAQDAVRGISPQSLRNDAGTRRDVAESLREVSGALDAMMVDRPRRAVIRRPRPEAAE